MTCWPWDKKCREAKRELGLSELELERQKLSIMADLANQPATSTNKALIIIPVVILAFGAVTAFVLIRKKKK